MVSTEEGGPELSSVKLRMNIDASIEGILKHVPELPLDDQLLVSLMLHHLHTAVEFHSLVPGYIVSMERCTRGVSFSAEANLQEKFEATKRDSVLGQVVQLRG